MKLLFTNIFFRRSLSVAGLVLVFCINFSWVSSAISLPEGRGGSNALKFESGNKEEASSEELLEVAPPLAVQQIRSRLDHYRPRLTLEYPRENEIIQKGINENWELVFNLQDWPLVDDPDLGLGPHLVVQVDDLQPLRITKSDTSRIVIQMNGLSILV